MAENDYWQKYYDKSLPLQCLLALDKNQLQIVCSKGILLKKIMTEFQHHSLGILDLQISICSKEIFICHV